MTMKSYAEFQSEVRDALKEIGMPDVYFSQSDDNGELMIETGIYLLDNEQVTDDPKVGCQCYQCDSCKEAGR
jgi:hypothetical protein